ncbi:MAG TPA: amidohydrolase family protein, partial [Chloroflexota bacterium]
PILVHPADAWRDALRLDHNVLETGFGFLMDDALTIMRMALNGTFDRFPDVRFMFCQLGGFATGCCARWDFHVRQYQLMSSRLGFPLPDWAKHTLTDYMARLWLDTHSQDRHILRLVMDVIGENGIVLGGDYPLTIPEDGVHWLMKELDALGVSPETKRKIERENALRLLGTRAPTSSAAAPL